MMNRCYEKIRTDWELVRDCYSGTSAIKNSPRQREYLPMSSREKREMQRQHDSSTSQYEFRKLYASYDNIFRPTIDDMVGIMQKNPLRIAFGAEKDDESPQEVRDMDVYGNLHNDGFKGLKWRLNFNQALYGRYGLLLDVVTDSSGLYPRFSISEYPAFRVLDGETGRSRADGESSLLWALLDETSLKFNREKKEWEQAPALRVLGFDSNGEYYQAVLAGDEPLEQWAEFNLSEPGYSAIYPNFRGKRLNFIPLTVCNVNTLGIDRWQEPPFLDVAHIAISLYRVDSLYKKSLWNFASPTLSVANADQTEKELFLGDAIWPRTNGQFPVSVSLLETNGVGLAEMRHAKEEMKQSLRYTSIRDLLEGAGANSSGQALELRTVSGTASIAAIDQTGARAIEEQVIFAAIWAGATSSEAANRISCRADTSYLTLGASLTSIASFIETNATADQGQPLLSKRNIYSMLEKTVPDTLTSFDDNELEK